MRIIKGKSLLKMISPAKFVMEHIHEAIINIAPERVEEFKNTYRDLTIEYIDNGNWICNVKSENNYIRLSRRVVEVLWCAAYSYVTIYTILSEKKKNRQKMEIVFHKEEKTNQAAKLLKWAYRCWLNADDLPWPADLPCPKVKPEKGSMEYVANELCLCAVAFLIHHELAHIRLGHKASVAGVELERDADYEAADWILGSGFDLDDQKATKRALGIALALGVTTAYGIHTGIYSNSKHPASYDRLTNTLSRHIDDPDHIVWLMLVTILKLHLDAVGVATPNIAHKSFFDCVNHYADLLAANKNNRGVDPPRSTP